MFFHLRNTFWKQTHFLSILFSGKKKREREKGIFLYCLSLFSTCTFNKLFCQEKEQRAQFNKKLQWLCYAILLLLLYHNLPFKWTLLCSWLWRWKESINCAARSFCTRKTQVQFESMSVWLSAVFVS